MKKKTVANIALLLGVLSILLPIFYGFGNALLILIFGKPVLPVLADKKIFLVLFSLIVVFSIAFSIAGLILKPRPLRNETIKMSVGLAMTIVSVILLGQILLSN